MEQYYPKSNLTITSSFRTPKAGNSKQGFSFERSGVPVTSTHHSQINKENNVMGIGSKKPLESQLKGESEQFGFAKASALDRKSYNFETYGTKQGQAVSNSTAYAPNRLTQASKGVSQPLLMSHDMNAFAAAATAKSRDQSHSNTTQPIQFTKNPTKADGRYAEKSSNYPQEIRNSRILSEDYLNANSRPDDKANDANNGNVYLKLISNLSMGSPKTKDTTAEARVNSSNRKAPQRASYDFANKELLQANALKNANKNAKPASYLNENPKPAVEDYKANTRKSFLNNEEGYSLAKASSVERTKQPESTKNRSIAPENQYSTYFSRGETTQQRGFGNGTTPTQPLVGALGSPKYTSDKGFKFQDKVQSQDKTKNQGEANISLEQEAAAYDNKHSKNNKMMSQKLEEYSSTLKKLEERIAKSKNERKEEKPKSQPPLINNFTSDSKAKGITSAVQSTSPKAGGKIATYQNYEEYERAAQVNDFGLLKSQARDNTQKDRYKTAANNNAQHSKGSYDSASQQPKYSMQSLSEKEYLEYLQNKNLREAEQGRQDALKHQAIQPRVKSAESFVEPSAADTKPANRARPESAKTKKSDQTPTYTKKDQPIVQKSLKDFVTQVNTGSGIPATSKPRLENFDEKEEDARYAGARLVPQSTKNSNVSNRYNETLVPQTTKHKDAEPKIFFSNNAKPKDKKSKESDQSQSSFTTYNETPSSNNTAIVASRQKGAPIYYMQSLERHFREPDFNDYFCKIYREHFMQSFQAMNFCRNLKDVDPKEILKRKVHIPRLDKHKDKKTIVFDLDETLIHCNENTSIPYDVLMPIKFPSGDIIEAGINIRPYARECLEELSKHFEIFVFTASHSCYANVVLDYLDPENKLIQHRLFRESCVQTEEGLYVKDLRIFANRNLKDLVLVDNAVYSFGYQIENGIPIAPFYYHKSDIELKALVPYLKSLALARDVREANRKTFKLHHYPNFETPEDLFEKLFE